MKVALRWAVLFSVILVSGQATNAQHHSSQSGDQHQKVKEHHNEVDRRGDQEMGFSHARTTHHFRLKSDGGIIEVTANDPDDNSSREQIRRHLNQISLKFSAGEFSAPVFIHGKTLPGVETMKRLKAEIKYRYEEIERGAQVRISTGNAEAAKAIHEFLRFQIKDHRTGDSGEVERGPAN
jgi:hypothetical protein